MSEKRRDLKNRILRTGESQRKDGRYVYKYKDLNGDTKFVYSWKLEKTDRLPPGKRQCTALRVLEKEINKNLDNGILMDKSLTLKDIILKYAPLKNNLKESTQVTYDIMVNKLINNKFCNRKITSIKLSDAKRWIIELQRENDYSYNYIKQLKNIMYSVFNQAIEDDLLHKNPFNFNANTVLQYKVRHREALSELEEERVLNFVKEDYYYKKYFNMIYILLNTGLRISEFCGLTFKDLDFDNNKIHVDHQVNKIKGEFIILSPKTHSGIRDVPMTEEVKSCFKSIIEKRKQPKIEPVVDGVTGFVYLNKFQEPITCLSIERAFRSITSKYNDKYPNECIYLTPHVCRHTFCTKLARKGINPKVLQYLMGHSDLQVTLNVYTHLAAEDIESEFSRVVSL